MATSIMALEGRAIPFSFHIWYALDATILLCSSFFLWRATRAATCAVCPPRQAAHSPRAWCALDATLLPSFSIYFSSFLPYFSSIFPPSFMWRAAGAATSAVCPPRQAAPPPRERCAGDATSPFILASLFSSYLPLSSLWRPPGVATSAACPTQAAPRQEANPKATPPTAHVPPGNPTPSAPPPPTPTFSTLNASSSSFIPRGAGNPPPAPPPPAPTQSTLSASSSSFFPSEAASPPRRAPARKRQRARRGAQPRQGNHAPCPPPDSAPGSLRVGLLNTGGLGAQQEAFILEFLVPRYDVVAVPEPRCNDASYFKYLHKTYGWRVVSSSREVRMGADGRPPPFTYGGALFILLNPKLHAINAILHDSRGLLVATIHPRKGAPSYDPIALVLSYIPPSSSPHYEAALETLPVLELVTNRCRAEFGTHNTLLLGDYNVRLGDRNPIGGTPRFSEDGDKANRTALSNPIIKTFKNLELCPLMGREQGAPALVTSRSWAAGPGITPAPGKGAEVDYILGHFNSTPPYTVDPPLPWEAHPGTCTHRTIGISITLLPATVYSSRPAMAAPSKRHLPLYSNNVAHAKVGEAFLDKLNALVGPAPDDPALLFKAFNSALEEAIQAGTPPEQHKGHPTRKKGETATTPHDMIEIIKGRAYPLQKCQKGSKSAFCVMWRISLFFKS